MSAAAVEAFLARIYSDATERARFLADPRGAALSAGLDAQEAEALAAIDRGGLALTAKSLASKRSARGRSPHAPDSSWSARRRRVFQWLKRLTRS